MTALTADSRPSLPASPTVRIEADTAQTAKEVGDGAIDIVGEPLSADLVWILTVMACCDLVPAAAVEQGAPS